MLDLNEIRDYFGNTIFNRGLNYYQQERVLDLKFDSDEDGDYYIQGAVRGSGNSRYYCAAEVTADGEIVDSHCSCPYPADCKHAAALLLAFLEQQPATVAATGGELQPVDPETLPTEQQIIIQPQDKGSSKLASRLQQNTLDDPQANYYPAFRILKRMYMKPALEIMRQYIKKDGTAGALSPFSRTKTYRIQSPQVEKLIRLFLSLDENTIPLNHIPGLFLDALPDMRLYNTEKQPVRIHRFNRCLFSMSGIEIDSQNNISFFPIIQPPAENNDPQPDFQAIDTISLPNSLLFYKNEGEDLLVCDGPDPLIRFLEAAMNRPAKYSADEADQLLRLAAQYAPALRTEPLLQRITIRSELPQPAVYLHRRISVTLLIPLFYYGETVVSPACTDQRVLLHRDDKELCIGERIIQHENYLLKEFYSLCERLDPTSIQKIPHNSHPLIDAPPQQVISEHGRDFLEAGFHIVLDPDNGKKITSTASTKLNITSGIDWFDLALYAGDDQEPLQLDSSLLENGVVERDGETVLLDRETLQQLERFQDRATLVDGRLRIDRLQFSLIEELYQQAAARDKQFESAAQLGRKLLGLTELPAVKPPRSFHGELRPYQQTGLEWMSLLLNNGLGGCLADDMGLGKTVQTIALIQSLRAKRMSGPVLIVVPVSTLFNWEAEFAVFAPSVKCLIHRGSERHREAAQLTEQKVILTSYHTLRNDIELFSSIVFPLVILDEAQAIKNSGSLIFKAVKTLQAERRLTLTGTPIENNTLELWSQLNFLNPGLLGSKEKFRKRFANPIEKQSDPAAAEQLNRISAPFILRRRKESVALDLPAKEEVLLFAEMGKQQRKLYDTIREEYRKKITAAKNRRNDEQHGKFKFFSLVIEGMLRLRQVCLFPGLIDAKYNSTGSCKLERLAELLPEITDEQHKILLFSQFTKVLKELQKSLPYKPAELCYLDGATRDRKKVVEQFQNNPKKKLFLISLKAGGTGLNLTAAEYVFIFDPWWNPAVEAQAIDRAHRIGQEQKVFAYKLIVKDSIEEKILQLQQKKKELADSLISEEQGALKKLSEAEILRLFS